MVVGETTFGKGLVQIVRPMPYGTALKLTVSRYYTPSGRSIQSVDYQQGRDARIQLGGGAGDVGEASMHIYIYIYMHMCHEAWEVPMLPGGVVVGVRRVVGFRLLGREPGRSARERIVWLVGDT